MQTSLLCQKGSKIEYNNRRKLKNETNKYMTTPFPGLINVEGVLVLCAQNFNTN
jgi:hypothetical protein